MEKISARAVLPYFLVLPSGDYAIAATGYPLRLYDSNIGTESDPRWRTEVEMSFDVPSALDDAAAETVQLRRAGDLLVETNRLIRWYRTASQLPEITELKRSQLSPVHFFGPASSPWRGLKALTFAATPPPRRAVDIEHVITTVRNGLAQHNDPPVSAVNLLDAEHARLTGRFRESVLHCWGAIDATFSVKYAQLAGKALVGEPADTITYLAEFEVPLKVRMSGMMHLVAGRSLAREQGLWEELKKSYDTRNGIIHRGVPASEQDADRAITVAGRVIALMESL